eukprot:PhM_4_TR18430/c0_g1_i1/m.28869
MNTSDSAPLFNDDDYDVVNNGADKQNGDLSNVNSSTNIPQGQQEEHDTLGSDSVLIGPISTRTVELDANDAIELVGFGRFQIQLLFMVGSVLGSDAMEVLLLTFIKQGVQDHLGASTLEVTLLSSMVFAGMFFGASATGVISDSWGRRWAFTFTTIITVIASLLSSLAPNIAIFILLRFFVGVGLGGSHVAFALYIEYLPASSRSLQLTFIQSFWIGGVFLQCLLAYLTRNTSWRVLVFLSAVPVGIACAMCKFLPESPRFLILKHRAEEATECIRRAA